MPVIDPDAWLEQQSGTSVATNVQAQPKPNVGGKGVLDPDEWLKAQGQAGGGGGGGVSNGSGGNFHLMKNTSDAQASNYSPEGAKENQVVTNFPNAAAGRTGGGASRPAIDPAMITAQPALPLAGRQPTLGEIVSTLFTPKPGGFAQMPQSPPQDNAVVAQQFGKLGQVIMGLGNLAKKVENAIATPGGVATAGLEGVIGKAAAGGFAAQQVPEIPGQVVQALKTLKDENADLRQKLEAVGQPVVTTAMTGLMARHAGEGIAEKLPTISRALNPSEAANADFRAQLTRKAESASGTQEQVSRQPLKTTGKQYPWITKPHVIGKPAPIISAPLGSSVQSSLYHPPETEEAVGQYEDFVKRGQEATQIQPSSASPIKTTASTASTSSVKDRIQSAETTLEKLSGGDSSLADGLRLHADRLKLSDEEYAGKLEQAVNNLTQKKLGSGEEQQSPAETIKGPAVRTAAGDVLSAEPGNTHADIILDNVRAGKLEDVDPERGFTTSTGRFVGREEAAKIQGQDKPLTSEDLPEFKNLSEQAKRAAEDRQRRVSIMAETEGQGTQQTQEQQQQQIGDVKPGQEFLGPPREPTPEQTKAGVKPQASPIPQNAIVISKNFFADNRPSKTWTEEVKANVGYLAGKTVPRTKAIDSDVGEQLIKYGSSRITAPALGKAMASLVLGDHWEDAAFSTKLGAVIVQDLRDKMRGEYTKTGDSDQAAKVHDTWEQEDSPFKSREEYEKALNDPEIAAAVKRHMEQVQPLALEQHLATGGKQAAGGERTGAFVNLKAMFDEAESTRDMIFGSKQGNLTNPLKRGSVFGRERKGTAQAYELDYRNIAERMVRGNYEQAQLHKLYDMYLQKGLAYEEYPGGDTKDKYTKVGPIEFKNGIKNLWVRSDLAHELNQALATDKPLPSTLGQAAIGFLNDIQVAGPTDASLHIGNMWGAIAGSQGGKSMLADIARQVPGVRGLDTMTRIAYNMRRAYMDTPDVQEVIAKLSEIGAGRSVVEHKGLLERVLPTSKLIKLVDRAGRLTLNDMFDNLVQRKLVEDTPEQRREFVNQLGQYNARLRGKVDSVLRESGVSPFIVAGKNFNRLAMQRLLLHPGVQAANINAAVKMRLVNALGLVATVASMPLVINSYTTGRPFGRKDKNIPLGAIDTGKDDKDGNAVIFDLLHGTFLRRALRITGAQGFERSEEGQQPVGEALDTAARQALEGFMGPFTGPFPSAAYTAMTGKDVRTGMTVSENPMSQGANAWAAFTRLNPSLAAAYKGWFDDQGGKAKDIAAEELGQLRRAVGVTTARPKSLSQQEHEAGAESMSLAQRAAYQKNLESQRKPLTDQKARLAMEESFAVRQRANVESIESSLPKEVRAFVSTNQLVLPEYNEKIHLPKQGGQAAGDVTLLPKERVQYQRVMAKEYQTAVRSLMNDSYFDSLDQESKQKALGTVIKQAHVRAKAKMEALLSTR